ncbi:MAG: hypothetical protein KBC96_13925 [Armatimonadetes bacterium]|nr:hypothetical protein [Armatimonadota bacterium]
MLRYSVSHRKRLIDSKPWQDHTGPLLVWDRELKEWVAPTDLRCTEWIDSVPISDEEAARVVETGELSESILRRLEYEMPDPWDD